MRRLRGEDEAGQACDLSDRAPARLLEHRFGARTSIHCAMRCRQARGEQPKRSRNARLKWAASLNPRP